MKASQETRMDTSTIRATLVRQDRHLQRLVHGEQSYSRRWVAEHGSDDPELAAWLSAELRLSDQPAHLAQAPEALRLPWQGWLDYYRGDYPAAAASFTRAWATLGEAPDEAALAADIALGLGKVYTRSGHWQDARCWLLHSLQQSRDEQRLFGLVQAYGALGELMLRAAQPQAAHACMSTAYHLLPPGSGQQPRQLNYLASTLMRSGAALRAESLLMTSLHMAHDAKDADSVWHALARLQFLLLDDRRQSAPDVLLTLCDYLPTRLTPVAAGFLHVGRAMREQRLGNTGAARKCLHSALGVLDLPGQALPCERAWVDRLLATLDGLPVAPPPAVCQLLALEALPAPPGESILDRTWASLALPAENGFAWLCEEVESFDATMVRRACFFI